MSTSVNGKKLVGDLDTAFLYALALLFIAFKLAGIIAWSWLWVLAPIWGPALFALVVIIGVGISGGVAFLVRRASRKRRERSLRW